MNLISAANKFSDNNLQCSVHVLFLTISMEESPEIGIGLGVVYFRLFYCNLLVKSRLNEDAGVPSINKYIIIILLSQNKYRLNFYGFYGHEKGYQRYFN